MGTIMRGDQTLRLIQLYYGHYPDIARNSQDAEGRRSRAQMWQRITDELNACYGTSFSVEQYKKKIQNVQCTSRQKLQTGKRNLGVAEFEYLRLFEQERLTGNGLMTDSMEQPATRSSSADTSSNVKVEQMLEQFGITLDPQTNLLNEGIPSEPGCASDSDSNTTTIPSVTDLNPPKSPTLSTPPNIVDPRQLILALGQLSQLNQEIRNSAPNANAATNQRSDPLEGVQPLTSKRLFPSDENNRLLPKKKRINGLVNVDDKWKRNMVEIQQQILENQCRILEQSDHREPTVDLSSIDKKLGQLCATLTALNSTLSRCFPPKPSADVSTTTPIDNIKSE